MIQFTIPVKTTNPLNGSQGRTKGAIYGKATRRKKERNTAWALAREAYAETLVPEAIGPVPTVVTLRRVSSGTLDGDGLQAALKSVRDGIADALCINDGSDAVAWRYEQRKCKRGEWAVEVTIT